MGVARYEGYTWECDHADQVESAVADLNDFSTEGEDDEGNQEHLEELIIGWLDYDWQWLKKYIDIDHLLKNLNYAIESN